MKNRGLSKLLVLLSLVAVALAGYGYLKQDIWLASTQWILVAIYLALIGEYIKK